MNSARSSNISAVSLFAAFARADCSTGTPCWSRRRACSFLSKRTHSWSSVLPSPPRVMTETISTGRAVTPCWNSPLISFSFTILWTKSSIFAWPFPMMFISLGENLLVQSEQMSKLQLPIPFLRSMVHLQEEPWPLRFFPQMLQVQWPPPNPSVRSWPLGH